MNSAAMIPPPTLPPGFMTVLFVIFAIIYYIMMIPMFGMYYKAKTPLPWLAFIPIANMVPFFPVIRVSMWNYLWLLPGIVGDIVYFGFHNGRNERTGRNGLVELRRAGYRQA